MWTLKENDGSGDGDSASGSWSSSSKSTFIDLNAKMYRNPNAALEILPSREQQKKRYTRPYPNKEKEAEKNQQHIK